jgi:hypothetical protein
MDAATQPATNVVTSGDPAPHTLRRDEETMSNGDAVNRIEIKLRDLSQLFETLDPLPFRARDLATHAEEYITDSAREMPRDRPFELVVYLPEGTGEQEASRDLRASIATFFRQRAAVTNRELRELFSTGRRTLLIGCLILGACLILAQAFAAFMPENGIVVFVEEGLVIVGWVALWRPLEIFLYEWWPIAKERKLFERLAVADIRLRFYDPEGHTGA